MLLQNRLGRLRFLFQKYLFIFRLNAVEVDVIELKQSVDANFKILHRYVALHDR